MKLLAALLLLSASTALAVTIPTVPVGDAGNANDPLTGNQYGGVSYEYRIGTTEVTNAQYAEFLNAKAASDPLRLYTPDADTGGANGIAQSGASGSYIYTVKPGMANKPVNYVDSYDAMRFANWLHNGQGAGDTETGAYTLLGGTPIPSNGLQVTRNPGATWFLPSENEWYKAAYYQPAAQGGDADNYWLYPTRSNVTPTRALADSAGDVINPGPNVANHSFVLGGPNFQEMTVGGAGPLSESYYGTSDQGGNVLEWNETVIANLFRGIRGGYYGDNSEWLRSTFHATYFFADAEVAGFRVATIPEPSTYLLGALALMGLLAFRRRVCDRPR